MSKLLSVLGTVSDKQPSLTVKPFAECRVLILFSRLFHHFQRTKFCGVRYVDLICSLDVLMYVLHLLLRPSGVRFWIWMLHLNQIFVLKALFYATAINSCTMSSTTTIDQYCSVVCNSSGFWYIKWCTFECRFSISVCTPKLPGLCCCETKHFVVFSAWVVIWC